jgi:hypothetical protein
MLNLVGLTWKNLTSLAYNETHNSVLLTLKLVTHSLADTGTYNSPVLLILKLVTHSLADTGTYNSPVLLIL